MSQLDLPEFLDKLDSPPYKDVLRDYEVEEAIVSFLDYTFGELFTREVQMELGDEY